jgi:hypothetical protein
VVSVGFDETVAIPPEQEPPYLLDRLLGGPQGPSGDFGKGRKFLPPTDIQSTIVRLSSQYRSYCTDWAIRSNTHEFVSWLSQMFIGCWFAVKLTANKIFLLIECLEI